MNTKTFAILILAFICVSQGANAIEVGLKQKYGESTSSYIYDSDLL